MNEELTDLIADAIYTALRERDKDSAKWKKPYADLKESAKEFYRGIAHNIINIFDAYYDGEYDGDDEDYDDDEEDFDLPLDDDEDDEMLEEDIIRW
jgi:hypothetical protein